MPPATPVVQAPEGGLPPLRFGPFLLDRRGGQLLRDGQPVDLAPRPWALLCHLAERAGELVTKDALLDAVWGHRFVSESALKVAINTLRQALGEDARGPGWIQTVPRRGYRFHDGVVALVPAADPAPTGPAPAARPGADASAPVPPEPTAEPTAEPPAEPPAQPPAQPPAGADRASPPPGGGNLPAPPPLIGRAEALARLCQALPRQRLLTLVGPGGVGKTSLALAAAAAARQADGLPTWLLRLDDLDDATGLGPALARLLGLGDEAGEAPAALARALAPLRLRLLLDNAEHLAEAIAPQLAQWLQAAPGLQLLLTSQRPLQLQGEQRWPVAPLDLPHTGAATAALPDNPCVALLLQRVRGRRPGWQPAPAELAELATIARALDGLPLALELAAARVALLGAAGVRQRLDARLQLLTGGPADAPDRHRTLRASLAWSVGLLPPLAARALGWLAVFAGGFSVDAAQALLAAALPETDEWARLDTLQLLQDLALLAPADPPPHEAAPDAPPPVAGSAAPGPLAGPRLRLLDSVRLLALERLAEAGELQAARDTHLRWVHACWRQAEDAYLQTGVETWLLPLEPEVANLIAAVSHALASPTGGPPPPAPDPQPGPGQAELASLLAACTHFCLRTGLGPRLLRWRQQLLPPGAPLPAHWPPALQGRWCLGGALLGGPGLLGIAEAQALAEQAEALLDGLPLQQQMARYVSGLFQLRRGQTEALHATLARMRQWPAPGAPAPAPARRLRPMLEASVAQARGDLAAYQAFWEQDLHDALAQGDRFQAWRAAWGVGQARFLHDDLAGAAAVTRPLLAQVRAAGRLGAQSGMASQALLMQLACGLEPATLAALRELLPLLQSQGILFAALGDALAWVPWWQGRHAAALRIQAWADRVQAARATPRSHVARHLRQRFSQLSGGAALPADDGLDEATVLQLLWPGTPG